MSTRNNIRIYIAIMIMVLANITSRAQLAPMGSIYFQNQYLNNPALAGMENGLNINVGYRQQWSNLPGSPKIQVLTGEYTLTDKASVALNLSGDQIGLFERTRIVGTYAYHLPLNGNDKELSFGISAGILSEQVDYSRLDGDVSDVTVNNFNQRNQVFDGDFGIAYTSNSLNLQGAIPNLRSSFGFGDNRQKQVDNAKFYLAASYKIKLPTSWEASFEPKLAFRAVNGFDNVIDLGGNLSFIQNKIGLTAIYHSSKAASFGFSAQISNTFNLMCFYTTNTSSLMGQTNGNFELNLKMSLFKKQMN